MNVSARVGIFAVICFGIGAFSTAGCAAGEESDPGGVPDEEAAGEAASAIDWADGNWYYIRAKHSDKCLHQQGAVLHDGGLITEWDCVDQYNVQWRFEHAPDDYYYIRARHSGKCAHQHGGTQGNGDPITQWSCVNLPNVKWRLNPAPNNYYYIQVQHSGKCMCRRPSRSGETGLEVRGGENLAGGAAGREDRSAERAQREGPGRTT